MKALSSLAASQGISQSCRGDPGEGRVSLLAAPHCLRWYAESQRLPRDKMLLVANALLGFGWLRGCSGRLCAGQGSSCHQVIFPEATKPPGSMAGGASRLQSLPSPLLRPLAVC